MAAEYKPTIGVGTKIKQGETTIGYVSSISEIGAERDEVDVTTLSSMGGFREYIGGFRDGGEVTVTGFHVRGDAGQTALRTLSDSGEVVPFVVELPNADTLSFKAYVKSYKTGSVEIDNAIGFSAALRISGAVTYAATTV